jgi:hypothetical protein
LIVNGEIDDIARTAIAQLGERAAAIMEDRVAAHRRDNELEGAAFWAQVAVAVRALQAEATGARVPEKSRVV